MCAVIAVLGIARVRNRMVMRIGRMLVRVAGVRRRVLAVCRHGAAREWKEGSGHGLRGQDAHEQDDQRALESDEHAAAV
jgi:hypothetical protein